MFLIIPFQCLFTSLLKTNGTFREISDSFTTIEVFTLLLENLEPLGQYLLLRELTQMLHTGELQNPFIPNTIASMIDLYRKSIRHTIKEYQIFRDEIGAFYSQILTMMDEPFDIGHTFYVATCVLIQTQFMMKFNESAVKKAVEILNKLKSLIEEEKKVHKMLSNSQPPEGTDEKYFEEFEGQILLKIGLIEFEMNEAESKLSLWKLNNSTE